MNAGQFPALAELREENAGGASYLKLTVPYGRYRGMIATFDKTLACALRRRLNHRNAKKPYAVALVGSYDEAQLLFTECVEWAKKRREG